MPEQIPQSESARVAFTQMSLAEIEQHLGGLCQSLAEASVALELARKGELPAAPSRKPTRDIEACILEAAPKPGEPPISRRKLAVRAGYGYNRHFLDAVRHLLEAGELVEHDGRIGTATRVV